MLGHSLACIAIETSNHPIIERGCAQASTRERPAQSQAPTQLAYPNPKLGLLQHLTDQQPRISDLTPISTVPLFRDALRRNTVATLISLAPENRNSVDPV
jgi:hypothetical protein